jgi:signal peptidase I
LGDNRNDSEDSRYWGFVPEGDVVGRPFVVYFSIIPTDGDTASPTLRDRLRTALSFHVLR